MKKVAFILLLSSLSLFGCKEKESPLISNNIPESISINDLGEYIDDFSNAQQSAFAAFSQTKPFNISIRSTTNWGVNTNLNEAYSLMGRFPDNLSLEMPTGVYAKPDDTDMVWIKSSEFSELFGKEVSFTIQEGSQRQNFEMYVPQILLIEKLGPPNRLDIPRKGNILKWKADSRNSIGVVFLTYRCRDVPDDPASGKIVKNDFLILKDDGEFSLDEILQDDICKSIQFTVFRGNVVEFGNDVNFDIRSSDIHMYAIQ